MNKKLTVLAGAFLGMLLTAQAFAAYPVIDEPIAQPVRTSGFYLSGQLGWGEQQLEDDTIAGQQGVPPLSAKTSDESGLAGRLALGYDINRYFGIELGGNRWSDGKYKVKPVPPSSDPFRARADASAYAIDLLGKAQYLFTSGFKVFAKGGVAYVNYSEDKQVITRGQFPQFAGRMNGSDTTIKFRPEAVIGIGYQFNQHWSTELAYSRIFGSGDDLFSDSYIPNLDMAAIGITYSV